MKKNIFLIMIIALYAGYVYSDDQWVPFLTNNKSTDRINSIVPENKIIWAATNGGIVKWDTTSGKYSIEKIGEFESAAIDGNGVKWFGGYQCVFALKDTIWTSFTIENTPLLNKRNGIVIFITSDDINKRIICEMAWGVDYPNSHISLLSYDGTEWKELINFVAFSGITQLAIDTINPWNIWGSGNGGRYYLLFEKTASGYSILNSDQIGDTVTSVAIDRDNRVWMTGESKIYLFDRYNDSFVIYTPDITGVIGQPVYTIIDYNWVKWFGAQQSVVRFDGLSWVVYPYKKINEYDLLSAFTVDDYGNFWMGRSSSSQSFGLWRFHPPATGVNEKLSLPQADKIIGNSPNPFNPSTTISFSLSSSGKTELSVYSATGQLIRTLVSGPQSAGSHSVLWDGRDDTGKAVSSGVYISRLQMGNKVAVGRMLLLK